MAWPLHLKYDYTLMEHVFLMMNPSGVTKGLLQCDPFSEIHRFVVITLYIGRLL